MFFKKTLEDRAIGSFLGLAIGDALGAPVEFEPRGTYPKVTDFLPTPWGGLKAGEWTDDTAMAICLAFKLLESKGYDSHAVMAEYVAWWREGKYTPTGQCYGIGEQTVDVIDEYRRDPENYRNPPTNQAGNGCIMRLAPVAIAAHQLPTQKERDKLISLSCQDTHNSLEAMEATILFGRLIENLLNGAGKKAALRAARRNFNDTYGIVDHLIEGNKWNIDGDGYVRTSLQAAWVCFNSTKNFREAVEMAVNLGGDTDTIGAITGQLAGAHYSASGIPSEWREKIYMGDILESLAQSLLELNPRIIQTRILEYPSSSAKDPNFRPKLKD